MFKFSSLICRYLLLYCFIALLLAVAPSPVLAQQQQNPPGQLDPITGIGGFLPNLFADFTTPVGVGGILEKFFTNTLGFLTLLAALAFIIYFVLGAFSWLTAGGKAEQLKKAQDQITNALIGLVIIVVAYTVFYIIGKILGLNILSPAQELLKLNPKGVTL